MKKIVKVGMLGVAVTSVYKRGPFVVILFCTVLMMTFASRIVSTPQSDEALVSIVGHLHCREDKIL